MRKYHVCKDGGFQYDMKHLLASAKKEMHMTHLQLMQLLQLAIISLTSLFTALIAVDGTLCDNRPSVHGKTTCSDDKMPYNTWINSAESWRQHVAGHLNCPKYL